MFSYTSLALKENVRIIKNLYQNTALSQVHMAPDSGCAWRQCSGTHFRGRNSSLISHMNPSNNGQEMKFCRNSVQFMFPFESQRPGIFQDCLTHCYTYVSSYSF